MSFNELGIASEVVGSIAVILTLFILAFQISRARIEMSRENARELIRHNNEILLRLSDNSQLLDVHIRGQKNFENLSEAEKMKWGFWLFAWITQTEQGFIDLKQKNFSGLDLEAYLEGLALALRSNGGKAIWPQMKVWFDPAFCIALDHQIAKSTTTQIQYISELNMGSVTSKVS